MGKRVKGIRPSRGAVSCNGSLLWKRAYRQLAVELNTTQGMLTYTTIQGLYGKRIAEIMDDLKQRDPAIEVSEYAE